VSDARSDVLSRLRACQIEVPPLPLLDEPWQSFDDLRATFQESVAKVGGRAVPVSARDALPEALLACDAYRTASVVCSTVPGLGRSDVQLDAVDNPHALSGVSLAILEARLGVAENGAVWLTDETLRHRAICFIAEHLVVVLDGTQIVATLHEAYARIELGCGFGLFLSGPSKTADIEQALVIGAHGARSVTVFVVG
jgi:L-lactate dehydrogenase complex protein LldG